MGSRLSLPFPYLPGEQSPDSFEERTQQNMDAIALALGQFGSNFGSRRLQAGSDTVTFAATQEATRQVTHNLGATPGFAIAFPILSTGEYLTGAVRAGSQTNTQITFQFSAGTVISVARDFYWLAIT